jgi:hypothetical protein
MSYNASVVKIYIRQKQLTYILRFENKNVVLYYENNFSLCTYFNGEHRSKFALGAKLKMASGR